MEETNWVVRINEELRSNGPSVTEKELWKRHSIYKVPLHFTKLNKTAYTPKAVSFGPYHYGEEHLKAMEEHKHRALILFLKRCKKPIELLYHRMNQVEQELRDSYKPPKDTPSFLQIMILDGCFMLEILRASESTDPHDFADNDPIFGKHGERNVVPFIKRDMLMLENQIPMRVLHILVEVENDTIQEDDELLNKRILKFFHKPEVTTGKCMHVLDLYRKSLIQHRPNHQRRQPKDSFSKKLLSKWKRGFERSIRELHEVGIRFEKSKTKSLTGVSFRRGKLSLPYMKVNEDTEYEFLNLIAFERLHVGASKEVTSYVFFMDQIIDTEADVALLQKNGILSSNLGNNKDVAKLFNSMAKDITVHVEDFGDLETVMIDISNYCKKPWKKWRANLYQTYFRNPWALVSLKAAIFLFALTIIQTVYTILQYYEQQQSSTPTPSPSPFGIPIPRPWHRP